ncbi:MAG: 4'-phosphopantetheinyl transferase superfamily protein [Holosporaceae bacterium]|jgi:phosphopantetheinyl transferase (holo-ACP synthase)|nr:4'-phosphopantetheinyl transferase superfamily protein [Holosporaceae bacterium]
MIENDLRLFEFPFFFKGEEKKCALALIRTDNFSAEDAVDYLSDNELKRMRSISREKAKICYCFGRVVAKKALGMLIDGLIYRDLDVGNEKSGCPTTGNCDFSVSITHTDEVAACLAYGKEFSFGTDIEKMNENRIDALRYVISGKEPIPNDLKSLTVAWTLKESLSKALKCGFGLPFEEFELSEFRGNGEFFVCSYARHPEFFGAATVFENNSYAAAFPRELFSDLPTPESAAEHPLVKKFRRAIFRGRNSDDS